MRKPPDHLRTTFRDIRARELPGTIEITGPAPIVAHLASDEAWAEQCGVPFHETVGRAAEIAAVTIETNGSLKISCLGAVLACR